MIDRLVFRRKVRRHVGFEEAKSEGDDVAATLHAKKSPTLPYAYKCTTCELAMSLNVWEGVGFESYKP